MRGNQLGLERALTVPRHVDRQRAILGEDRRGPRPVAMTGAALGLTAAGRIPEVVGQLAAEGTFDDGLLEPPNGGIELLGTHRTLPDELVQNL